MHFAALAVISIHALREEGDPEPDSCDCEFVVFLSTPSARRATELHSFRQGQSEISIHALREEGDGATCRPDRRTGGFLSTPSARRATEYPATVVVRGPFLSTPSARRATGGAAAACKKRRISIHALREEGDRRKLSVRWPCTAISIHALREEGDAGGNRR